VAIHLGDVVRELRESAGLSKNALARRAGIDVSLISRLENHIHHTLSPDNLARVAQALDVTVEEIHRRVGGNNRPPSPPMPLEEWLARDPNLTDRQRAAILAVYEGFVRRG